MKRSDLAIGPANPHVQDAKLDRGWAFHLRFRKIVHDFERFDTAATAQPLRPHGTLAAASHLMIAHPFPPDGVGGMLSTHPPTSERVRRLEALSGGPRLPGG